MVNYIGGATLSAALVAEKSLEPKKIANPVADGGSADLSASVASYLSLPGFNATSPLQSETGAADTSGDQASAVVKAVAESGDDSLKLALKQFDDGLKKLAERPETQVFQARFGVNATDGSASVNGNDNGNGDLPAPDPLPGVGEDGMLASVSKEEMSADTNHDGKISEDERRRYQLPITYRSSERSTDALADGPSAFSLAEANRAYGVVAKATVAAA